MTAAPLPPDDVERVAALRRLGILDTPAEERFDRLTRLTSTILGTPIALISLVDESRQWFKSRIGLEAPETHRDLAFCSHAVAQADEAPTMVVEDASDDARFATNPLVTGDPNIRFYAGQVLRSPDGFAIGTLCAIDRRPRTLDASQQRALADIAALVEHEIDEMRNVNRLVELEAALRASEESARVSLDSLTQGVILADGVGGVRRLNPAAVRILGYTREELEERWRAGTWATFDADGNPLPDDQRPIVRAMRGETVDGDVIGWFRADGQRIMLRASCVPTGAGDGSMIIAFSDITREHALTQDIARYQHLFHHADDIITVIDANGMVQFSSPSAERVLGYDETTRHRDGILGLVHPDDLAGAAEELRKLADASRGPEPFTVRVQAADGTWRHLECVGANLLDEPAIRGLLLTSRDVTERAELTAQLEYLAEHDALTGLRNRGALVPSLERDLARSARDPRARTAVCFIDLDHFKAVNDTYGHAAGDDVIRSVGLRIEDTIRGGDTAIRIGGDEFVVVMHPVASEEAALAVATRLRRALVDPAIEVGAHTVGASIGVAVNVHGEDATALLARADAALYQAKRNRPSALVLAE